MERGVLSKWKKFLFVENDRVIEERFDWENFWNSIGRHYETYTETQFEVIRNT